MNTTNLIRSISRSCTLFKDQKHVFGSVKPLKICRMALSTNASQSITQKAKESFEDVLPSILDTVTTNTQFADVPEVGNWVKKTLEYNLQGGKKTRGMTTLFAYEMLVKPENITDESIHSAKMMGWCVEMLQTYLLVLDDIMDSSSTRRGVACWYRLPDVGLGAINDAILIYSSMFHVIKTQFGNEKFYTKVLELFNETLFQTSVGQHLDVKMANRHKNDYSLFTIEQYTAIVKYKTAYYTYKLPVCLGLLLANNTDHAKHKMAEDICLEIGKFFQMQDDYIDCYGEESVSGKKGTDIQEGKCSWLAVMALQRCSPAQRIVFTTCYGSQEPAHIERIKELYKQLKLPELYASTETRMYESLVSQARALPEDMSPSLFIKLIDMIYKRRGYAQPLHLLRGSLSTKVYPTITQKNQDPSQDVFPLILDTVSKNRQYAEVPDVKNQLNKALKYNLPGGKKTRVMTTSLAYEMLEKPENINEETIHSAKVLGWCVEMLHAYFMILDDIMDSATTRRSMPCWYRLPGVGLGAINDAILIYTSMLNVVKTHFGGKEFYANMLDLFNDALTQTIIGQKMDMMMAHRNKKDYSLFTMDQYNVIAKHKTAYYTYKLPVCLGMLLANITDPAKHQKTGDLCLEMGKLHQIQDDYIDCFGDETVSGKQGTDIREGKCSWLAIMALQRCTPAQRIVFTTCYGSQEPAHIERIKVLYQQLQLPEIYAQTESTMYDTLVNQAQTLPKDLSPELFIKLIDMLYKSTC